MKKKTFIFIISTLLSSCSLSSNTNAIASSYHSSNQISNANEKSDIPKLNDEYYRGFSLDNILVSNTLGPIHYNVMVPSDYDGSKPYALFFTLPGYQGLYRFGVGINLRTEDFAFEAQNYVKDMIIVAPQLSDWGTTSARQTIELVHYFIDNYNIDENRIFAEGYSGGGETMSTTMVLNRNCLLDICIAPLNGMEI